MSTQFRKGITMTMSKQSVKYVSLTDKTQSLIKIEAMKRDLEAKQAALDFSKASLSVESENKPSKYSRPNWKHENNVDEVSTISDISNAEFMN